MSETTAIDCLPYHDTFDEADRARANKLVEQEMKTFAAKDYLEDQPIAGVEFSKYSPTLAQMWQTMETSGNYSMPDMDLLRYSMPPATNNDYESWHRAVLNAQTQIEHQVNRLENLELLKSFGANAWRHHLVYLEGEKKALDKQFDQLRKEREELNKQRKTDQSNAGNKLTALHDRFYALLMKNAEILAACEQLEAENQQAKGALSAEQQQHINAQSNLYSSNNQNGTQNM